MSTETYKVYRNGQVIANGLTATQFTDTAVQAATTYTYKVGAVIGQQETLSNEVTVTTKPIAVTGIVLTSTENKLGIGHTLELQATVAPDNATDKTVTYTTSNTSVATVSSTGVVSGVAEGAVEITAKAGEHSDTLSFNVYKMETLTITVDEQETTGEQYVLEISQADYLVLLANGAVDPDIVYSVIPEEGSD